MYSAKVIARWFLQKSDTEKDNSYITNMKLQKLLYYAQGAFLSLKGTPLFKEKVQAWQYGPVVPEVYNQYKSYSSNEIDRYAPLESGEIEQADELLLNCIYGLYGGYTAIELSQQTHRETPWKQTKQFSEIDNELIKDFFAKNVFNAVLSGDVFNSIPILAGTQGRDGATVFPASARDELED